MKRDRTPVVTWTQTQAPMRQSLRGKIGVLLPLALLCAAFGLWLQTTFPSLAGWFWVFAPAAFALGTALLLCIGTRAEKWAFLAVLLAVLPVFFLCRKSFLLLVNDFCSALQRVSGHIYLHFETDGRVWPILFVLISGCAVLFSRACSSGSLLWLLPMLIPMAEGALAGVAPFRLGAALFIGGMLLLFRRQNLNMRAMLVRTAATVLSLLVALCVALPFRDMPANALYPALREAAHDLIYDRRTNAMPEGKLSKVKAFHKTTTPALSVTLEKPQALYLRGAIYESYTGRAWKALPSETRAGFAQLFYWLHDADYYGQTQIAAALRETGAVPVQQITVQNLSACRAHGYLPYGADGIGADETLIGDAEIPDVHAFSCFADDAETLRTAQSELVGAQSRHADFLQLEQAYADYARKVDLAITDASRAVLDREFSGRVSASASLGEIRTAIRTYLDETLTYDETVGAMPKQADFLQALLEGSRSGYSVHFATAAVLMLRYCGVPARYTEGYYLGENDGGTITLTEENAHAWAEMYLDGIGFVPFEVTPGYAGDDSTQQDGEKSRNRASKSPAAEPFNSPPQSVLPEEIEPQPESFSLWLIFLLILLLLLALAALRIVLRRRRLRKALDAINALEPREAVKRRYAYTLLLRDLVPEPMHDSEAVAEAVRLSQFSNHTITETHRRAVDAFALAVRTDCMRQWSFPRRLYYRFIRVVCL